MTGHSVFGVSTMALARSMSLLKSTDLSRLWLVWDGEILRRECCGWLWPGRARRRAAGYWALGCWPEQELGSLFVWPAAQRPEPDSPLLFFLRQIQIRQRSL